jgi:hypothetical protein
MQISKVPAVSSSSMTSAPNPNDITLRAMSEGETKF